MNSYQPHHVALTVRDIDEAVIWYTDKFGFAVSKRYDDGENGRQMVLLKVTDHFHLELFSFAKGAQPLPDYRKTVLKDIEVIGTKHLCLKVEDLDAEIKRLKARDVKFIGKKDSAFFGGNYIFLKDPSGNLIEMCEVK